MTPVNRTLAKGNSDSSDFHPPEPGSIYQPISIVIIACLVHVRFILLRRSACHFLARLERVGKLRYDLNLYPRLSISAGSSSVFKRAFVTTWSPFRDDGDGYRSHYIEVATMGALSQLIHIQRYGPFLFC